MYNDLLIKDIINLWLNDEEMPLSFIYRERLFKKQKTIDLCTMYKDNDGSYFDFGLYLNKHEYVTCKIKDILDIQEKRYLYNIIKPFRHKVSYIVKQDCKDDEYITIKYFEYTNISNIILPGFYKNSMYKGMEIGREYSLKELGL
nr:MAG TPA: hypothetical protein [Caudoviricetes sp.]